MNAMMTTFKVIEFYRNNALGLLNSSSALNESLNGSDSCITNGSDLTLNKCTQIYNTLGFNVIGGYLSEIPATIVDVAANTNSNTTNGKIIRPKVEEGDVILEINGISTRHMTLNEVNKQLRCCGNRICLKIKSDLNYKTRFRESLKEDYQNKLNGSSSQHLRTSVSVNSTAELLNNCSLLNKNLTNNLTRNASKSYDNYINTYASCTGSTSMFMSPSIASSDFSSATNSHSNILESNSKTKSNSNNSTSLVTLSINDKQPQTQLQPLANESKSNDIEQTEDLNLMPQLITAISSTTTESSSSNSSSPHSSNDSGSTNQNIDTSIINPATNTEQINTQQSETNSDTADTIAPATGKFQMTDHNQPNHTPVLTFQVEIDDTIKKRIDEKLKECSSGDSDSDSEHNVYTQKAIDLPSVQRLAKRLYYLDGFKANDVVRHLSKKNDFSQLVADEYLKLFNFQSLTLDAALRKFLKQFQLVGDAQEKERVLLYFAKRYVDANNTAFTDVDSCHTLTCAIMLLNTDLHDSKIQNKMTLTEFIENLKGLNSGSNFPDVLLESLYSAIKNEPLECACLDGEDMPYDERGSGNGTNFSLRPIGSNPFLQIPDPHTAKEYKFGWLLRKCCIDSDGKKAPFLKRSWKMFYASLRDMVLYLHKDDKVFKNNTFDNITNAIRIHHTYAAVASDYKKKQFVFRLKTADWAEYLFQTSNSTELYEWVSTINLVAAMFSSPPLSGGIGSSKTFQRPLLPVSKTRYTLHEQYEYHKKHLKQLQTDLTKLESAAGACLNTLNNHTHQNHIKDDKSFDKDKYNYLKFEIQRYTIYANILEEKILSETAISSTIPAQFSIINPSFASDAANNYQYMNMTSVANSLQPATNKAYYSNSINANNIVNNHGNNMLGNHSNNSLFNANSMNATTVSSTTPTHYLNNSINSNSILKANNQNHMLHVNFNLSPNSNKNGLTNDLIPNANVTNNVIPAISLQTANNLNNKKFNNYLD